MARKNPGLTLIKKDTSPVSEIDELYQLPLNEFTAARNALAKRLGRTDPPIKDLQKPNVAAWAVNQLYWRERATFDRLVESSERLRAQHRKLLEGKTADLREAEKAHREAIKAASEKIKSILTEGGEAASQATMTAVSETLEALPSADAPAGRLARSLKPMGFEALTGVTLRPSQIAPAPPRGTPLERPSAPKQDAAAARREAAAARREAEAAKREAAKERERQRAALTELRRAEAALERAQAGFEKAQAEAKRRSEALEAAKETLNRLRRLT